MPDLTPSLDILKRLGLSTPPVANGPIQSMSREDYDAAVRASQANDPNWKKAARMGIGALGGAAKGLVGTDPSEELKQRIISGKATPDEKAEWYANGASQVAGQVSDAGLPFAAIRKGEGPIYHGAPRVFDKFDPSKYDKDDVLGWLTHFAENPEYANTYASGLKREAPKPNIIAAHPDAKNVLDLVNPNSDDLSQLIASLPKNDPRRSSLIQTFKYARDDPEYYRRQLKQTHYPESNKIPRDEIPALSIAQRIRLDPGELEKTPFDAIRYNDVKEKSWAIPETTPINTPWGTPLNNPPRDLTVTRLPETAGPNDTRSVLKAHGPEFAPPPTPYIDNPDLELSRMYGTKYENTSKPKSILDLPSESNFHDWTITHPYSDQPEKFGDYLSKYHTPEFHSSGQAQDMINSIQEHPDVWNGYSVTPPKSNPIKADVSSPGVDELFKLHGSSDADIAQKPWEGTPAFKPTHKTFGKGTNYDDTMNSYYTEDEANELIKKAEKMGIDWNKHPNYKSLSDEVNSQQPTAVHPEYGEIDKTEAGHLVNAGELSMNWYVKNFPN